MPAIRHLLCARRSLPSSVGVSSAPITAQDLDARMLLEPGGQCLASSIGEEIHPAAALQINQDRAIGTTTAKGEVIDTEHTGRTRGGKGGTTDNPQYGIGTSRHGDAF
jgi:hypothetical protein